MKNRLIEKISGKQEIAKLNLLCFPYAGAGASVYYRWKEYFGNKVMIYAIQLPGRENRISEPMYASVDEIMPDLLEAVGEIVKEKFILFGHSMGAKIAYELEKRLEQSGIYARHLIVSGSRPPHIPEPNVPGTFILSCGCFPGFTGLAMKYLCDSYESVNSISGICIDRQIPGVNGIIDFIISGLKGFGETSYYYYAGNKKYDDKQENFRDYDGKEVEIQKYFTTEIADVINKFSPRKAIWYTPALGREITEIMQKAVVGYIQTEQYISIFTYAQKIQKLIEEKSRGECETGCEINIWSSGLSGGKQRERSIVIKSSFGSSLTAAVLDTVTAKIMEKGLTPGIYYATDIISMLDVIKQNVNREINYYCNDESINIGTEGIVYEEGIL